MKHKLKILICGGSGQLGKDCESVLSENYDVVSMDLPEIDIGNKSSAEKIIHDIMPDVILNCAAFTRVDACETEKELAVKVNAVGPGNLAAAAKATSGLLVHISTDYVFDGRKPVPEAYREDDIPSPLSFYGKTKHDGEEAVKQINCRHIILRTAWLYGIHGANFLKTMLRLALNNPEKEIQVVNDQYGSPTWSYRLAGQIQKLLEENGQGIFHATAEGFCTWYEVADYFLKKMEIPYRLKPCLTKDYPTPAVRPGNSILENQRLKESGMNLMKEWRSDIDLFVLNFRKQLMAEIKQRPSNG